MSNPNDKDWLRLAAKAAHGHMPDGHGFILLATPFSVSARQPEPRLFYIANISRESAICVLKEWLIKASGPEDWMNHIQ